MAKLCSKCGRKTNDGKKLCENCENKKEVKNKNNLGSSKNYWWILGAILPPVGLVLYLLWRNKDSKKAKNVGTGALIVGIIGLFFAASLLANDKNYVKKPKEDNVLKEINIQTATKTMQSWYEDVASGKSVVTILASSTCPHCQEYKPVINELSKKEGFILYFFEMDQLTEEDLTVVTNAFELENYKGSVPYTFIVKDKKYISDTTGYRDQASTINYLKQNEIIEN